MYLPAWPGVATAAVDAAAVCSSKRPYRAGRTRAVAHTVVPGPPSLTLLLWSGPPFVLRLSTHPPSTPPRTPPQRRLIPCRRLRTPPPPTGLGHAPSAAGVAAE